MSLIDFILNIAGLLIWLNWRTARLALRHSPGGVTIARNLQRASPEPATGWGPFWLLLAILVGRALFYSFAGPMMNWVPGLDLVAVNLPWRSDSLLKMLLFSFTTFSLMLLGWHSWLLLLSAINQKVTDPDQILRWVRHQLGGLERLPRGLKLLLPGMFVVVFWPIAYKVLIWIGIAPPMSTAGQLWQSGLVLSAAAWWTWRWVLTGILLAHLLNSYLYLGDHPVWSFCSRTAGNLLYPFRFLTLGKVDLATLGCLGLLGALWGVVPDQLVLLYRKLPL